MLSSSGEEAPPMCSAPSSCLKTGRVYCPTQRDDMDDSVGGTSRLTRRRVPFANALLRSGPISMRHSRSPERPSSLANVTYRIRNHTSGFARVCLFVHWMVRGAIPDSNQPAGMPNSASAVPSRGTRRGVRRRTPLARQFPPLLGVYFPFFAFSTIGSSCPVDT